MRHATDARGYPADRGDIVVGWLTKLVLVTVVVGAVGFDALSVAVAKVSVADDASTAAQAAGYSWQTSKHDIQAAYDAAEQAVADKGEEQVDPGDFRIDADGTVHLTVHKKAHTLLLYRIGALSHVADVTGTATGKSLGS